jgi:hypothetical protein
MVSLTARITMAPCVEVATPCFKKSTPLGTPYSKTAFSFSVPKRGLIRLCYAKDVGHDSYVECLEKHSHECPFSVSFARSHY